jgi:hypothetical protein
VGGPKKWRGSDVELKVLEYLCGRPGATKYRVSKDLGIPLPTLLAAVRRMKGKGLVDYGLGKRRGHACRLTWRGLMQLLRSGPNVDLERAKDAFLAMLEERGVGRGELMERLSKGEARMSEKALSCYIKQYLLFLRDHPAPDPTLDDIIGQLRGDDQGLYYYDLRNFAGVLGHRMRNFVGLLTPLARDFYLPSPPSLSSLFVGSRDEVEELTGFMAKLNVEERSLLLDLFEDELNTKAGRPWRFGRWLAVGCLLIRLNVEVKDVDNLVRLLLLSSAGRTVSDSSGLFDVIASRVIYLARCPVDKGACKVDGVGERLRCERFMEAVKLKDEGSYPLRA